MKVCIKILLLAFTFFISKTARPDPIDIPGLFNTGLDDNSMLLDEYSVDPHYILISSADKEFNGPDTRVVKYNGFPMNCWYPNNSRSQWIAPSGDGRFEAQGTYIYRVTFDLGKFKPNTAVITGAWSSDNSGVDILINGKSSGYSTPLEAFKFGMFLFEIKSGFGDHINTIDFVVYNYNAPTGIRVELTGKAEPKEFVLN